jgi:Zn-dependent membrane protease YugP
MKPLAALTVAAHNLGLAVKDLQAISLAIQPTLTLANTLSMQLVILAR